MARHKNLYGFAWSMLILLVGVIAWLLIAWWIVFGSSTAASHATFSVACFQNTGNACLDNLAEPTGATGLGAGNCATTRCTTNPLPTGACCNALDFCYLPDPSKRCMGGQCISDNVTLCRGHCVTDSDCHNLTAPFPIWPTANPLLVCLNGGCVATVITTTGYVITPQDLLDTRTQAALNVSNCIEGSCTPIVTEGPVSQCMYAWRCSILNGFYDQNATKKRAWDAVRIYTNFTLPGGNARYSDAQYQSINELLNERMATRLQEVYGP